MRGRRQTRSYIIVGILFAIAVGAGRPLIAPINAAASAPAFVQQISGHGFNLTSLALTSGSNLTTGNRLVVEVGVWSSAGATAASVSDAAGNRYVELLHYQASEATELSVWTAPVTAGGGSRPAITVRPTSTADVGAAVLEYAGLSSVADATVVDQQAHASGTTGAARSVASGPTPAITAGNELALGFYTDSGFGNALGGDPNYAVRTSVGPTGDMELLVEDAIVAAGATPNASAGTGANTTWLMATIVLKAAPTGPPTIPSAPAAVTATAGNASATVAWTAPSDGGSPITSYTVTPYVGSVPQATTTVSGSPPATSVTISGLTNGTSYTFRVAASNAIGTGPESNPSNAVTPSTLPGGQWSSLTTWPIVAIHSVLLKTGQFLLWDGWAQPEPTQIWNPSTQTFMTIDAPNSIFCSGTAQLPDGRLMEVGGHGGPTLGIVDTSIFDPSTSTWTRVADMHAPRWYPDLVELADGRYVVISGNSTDPATWADTPEVYDPATNIWTVLTGISTSQVHEEEYPFSYLAPNGKVFTIGPSEDLSFFLDVTNRSWTPVGGASGIRNGSSVMYRPGKILYSGGAPSVINTTPAVANTAVIDITAGTPTWRQTALMANARVYHTLTMLADGTVLAVGGELTSDQGIVTSGQLSAEIWNPATETWSTVAPMAAARNYHSTAVLMPDGRVLVAGGGHGLNLSGAGQYSSQIYSPPYLFQGPRPTITAVPSAATYNSSISVTTPDATSISSVNLVSLGADTHQADMSQHFVPLSFTTGSGALNVQMPASASLAPPGTYMLFIVNSSGVPSVASFIGLATALTAPAPPTNVMAVAGNAQATVNWTPPANNGGSSITGYTVTSSPGGVTASAGASATSVVVNPLVNGTTYTFTVTATNAIGTSGPSPPSNAITPTAPTAPGPPTNVTAAAGNAQATVSWMPPVNNGGSAITGYTVTSSPGGVTVSSGASATSAVVSPLVNGTSYTFIVTATNAIGTSSPSAPSNAVTPAAAPALAFVQQLSGHSFTAASISVTPATNITTGNRLIVLVGVWNYGHPTTQSVTDSAGNTYTELLHFVASEGTEESVWSAPITNGGGTRPSITATPTANADVGIVVLEYSGLSTAGGSAAVDRLIQASGTTGGSAATVGSGATAATTAANELAVGFYVDSGFGDTLSYGSGFTGRTNVSPTGDMELLVEDRIVAAGSTPNAITGTGANTTWLMATAVFKAGP